MPREERGSEMAKNNNLTDSEAARKPAGSPSTLGVLFDSVVIISPFYWNFRDDMWQTTHNVARVFATMAPTVFVEPPVQWNPRSAEFRFYRLLHGIGGARTRVPERSMTVFHRRGLPLGSVEFVRNFDLTRNARTLKVLLKRFGFRNTLLWHSFPYWSEPIMEAVDHKAFAYHCLDHSACEEEARLISRADAVFCVSQTLVDKHKAFNPNTFLLPNGVDLALFDRARARASPRPTDLPKKGRVIGFLGYVNYHVDTELLVDVARAFPNDNVVLVGRVPSAQTVPQGKQLEALKILRTLPNVRVLGFKPTSEVPLYIHNFDVCLIPFLRNQFNLECDPLKFYQYMAMSKPVVSTPVIVAQRYRGACYLAETPEEFNAQISVALDESNRKDLQEKRLAVAQAHSWKTLVTGACVTLGEITSTQRSSPREVAG
jgi:glycosyltransferase involved in cell wall biosynthesis